MIKVFNLRRGNVLKRDDLYAACVSARQTYDYVKVVFYNRQYITVLFNRDNTLEIATTVTLLTLWYEINGIRRSGRFTSTMRVCDFLFNWINKLNK